MERTTKANPGPAPIRLRGSLGWVQEVGFVSAGANGRTYHQIRKASTVADALTLPTQAKTSLLDGIGTLLEQLIALNDAVKASQTTDDPNAAVPPEVAQTLTGFGAAINALAAQYGGAPPAAEPDGDEVLSAEEKGATEAYSAAVTAAAPVEDPEVAKALGEACAKALVKAYRKTLKTAAGVAAIAKGKGATKMTLQGFMKLHGSAMEKLMALVKEMAPLLSMEDDAPVTDAGKPPVVAPGAANKSGAAAAGAAGGDTAVVKTLAEIAANVAGMHTRLDAVLKNRGNGAANPDDRDGAAGAAGGDGGAGGGGGAEPVNKSKYGPGEDIAAAIQKKKAATQGDKPKGSHRYA